MNALTRRRFLLASGAAAVAADGGQPSAGRTSPTAPAATRCPSAPACSSSSPSTAATTGSTRWCPRPTRPTSRPAPTSPTARTRCSTSATASASTRVSTGLKQQWDNGTLAIVRGVGYPKPDHSHFRSMDIWQTASPDHPAGTGWIGRWLDAQRPRPAAAVSLEPVLPPLLAGATTAGAALPLRGLALPSGPLGDGVHGARAGRPRGSRRCRPTRRARSPTCTARSTPSGQGRRRTPTKAKTARRPTSRARSRPSSTSSRAASRRAPRPGCTR